MNDFNNQWIEIFAPGDYGPKGKYGPAELLAMVRNFKAGVWTPPAVIGHPETDSPAHAWAKDMRVNERGVLAVQFEKETPQLVALAKEGRFPNRSVAIYTNPKFDGPAVRHIGFLGATPPEVKGLAPVQFSDGDFVAIEFNEEEEMDEKQIKQTVMQSIEAWFAEKFGGKKPDGATFSEADMLAKVAEMKKEMAGKMEEGLAAIKKEFAEGAQKAKDALTASAKTSALERVKTFIAARVAANQWVPAFAEAKLDRVLEVLSIGAAVTFSEGVGDKKKDVTFGEAEAYTALTGFLEALPKIVPLGEVTGAQRQIAGGQRFNETPGLTISAESAALDAAAKKLMKEENISDYGKALQMARSRTPEGGPHLVGEATAGAA